MKLKMFLFTALLALAGSTFAATPPPPAGTGTSPTHMGPCEKDPSKCQADAAKFDNWCAANADKCVKLKAWAEKRREACEKDPQMCKERMEKMHKMHERMKAMCAKNPDDEHCKMMQEMKQGDEPGDDQDPPPSN